MCGSYYLAQEEGDGELAATLRQASERAARHGLRMLERGEMFPGQVVPVVATGAARREKGAFPMQWGFMHPAHGVRVYNTRIENAEEQKAFCTSLYDRRCLIPASGWFEWVRTDGGKERIRFFREDGRPVYLGGLYIRGGREPLPCFSVLTREAPDPIRFLHRRMPVLIPGTEADRWLDPSVPFREALPEGVPAIGFRAADTEKEERIV